MSLPSHPGIVTDKDALDARLAAWRAAGKRVVFTNGCYDILHPGHVDLLARARALGDVLVLGLNSDDSVRRLGKGPERPLNPFAARAFVAAHLESVDLVTVFDEDTPLALIERTRPDVLVKGGDWPLEAIVGGECVRARGGQVLSLPLLEGWSTTGLVESIRGGAPCPRP
jgi:rfaE bifunctional protein nucleotidyltransferase chain/domain